MINGFGSILRYAAMVWNDACPSQAALGIRSAREDAPNETSANKYAAGSVLRTKGRWPASMPWLGDRLLALVTNGRTLPNCGVLDAPWQGALPLRIRHQGFELGLRPLVIEKGGARGAEETGAFRP